MSARAAAIPGGHRGCCALRLPPVRAPRQKPARPPLSPSRNLSRFQTARSQSRERKKKRGGGGAADSGVLLALRWEDSSAATGGEGLRGGGGKGQGSLRGSEPSSTTRCQRAEAEGGKDDPCWVARPLPGAGGGGGAGCCFQIATGSMNCCRVFGDQPRKPIHVRTSPET